MPHAHQKIRHAPQLAFDASAGAADAPLVLLLHGFAESMHCWRAQVACLGDMGYRAIAPSQRGYSPGARPDPREFSHYLIDRLMDDAMAMVAAAGYGEARFHLAGHDWGGSIAWGIADRHHERLASLTILSRPHPNAFNRALMADGEQAQRSKHHKAFLEPDAADVVLARFQMLCERSRQCVPADAMLAYSPGSATGCDGSRTCGSCARAISGPLGPIGCDALFWGAADDTVWPRRRRSTRFHRSSLSFRGLTALCCALHSPNTDAACA